MTAQTTATATHPHPHTKANMRLQAPRGTRDFYPPQMALRNYLADAWRRVSVRNGFEHVDGPIFESLDLYKVKSGEGIVAELFHFEDRGERQLAIRPEFTPTLARMVAAQANSLPRPIKWFSVPNLCRAERPQRGRLREFFQWNIDVIGSDSPIADAECIFVAVDLMRELGLGPEAVKVKVSHRATVRHVLTRLGVSEDRMLEAFELLDRRDKLDQEQFVHRAAELGLAPDQVERFEQTCRMKYRIGSLDAMRSQLGIADALTDLEVLDNQLQAFGIADWCEYDLGIVRGLAYYTGMVFEIHEVSGAERAMAGGGRYDQLIKLFGGPDMPAVGFGMGDVVLSNVLADNGVLPENPAPGPDAFVIAVDDESAARLPGVVAALRTSGVHCRFSYKSSRGLGKQLKQADSAGARYAVILGNRVAEGLAGLKHLESGEQAEVRIDDLASRLLP